MYKINISVFSAFLALTSCSIATPSNTTVAFLQTGCSNELEDDCKLIVNTNGKQETLINGTRKAKVTQINNQFWRATISCGSPCHIDYIVSPSVRYSTQQYIAFDPTTQCLIEANLKKIYSYSLISKKKKLLIDFSKSKKFTQEEYQQIIGIPEIQISFDKKSFFGANHHFHLISGELAEKNDNDINLTFNNACEL